MKNFIREYALMMSGVVFLFGVLIITNWLWPVFIGLCTIFLALNIWAAFILLRDNMVMYFLKMMD